MTIVAAWSEGTGTFFNSGSSSASGLTPFVYLKKISRPAHHDPSVLAVQTAKRAIERLNDLEANWDGFGSAKPDRGAISRAISELPEWVSSSERVSGWSLPHVSANEAGEVVLEWWAESKKLTFFIRVDGVDYLRAWGEHIDDDMDDGPLTRGKFPQLWSWLSV